MGIHLQRNNVMTFSSQEGVILWYILSGFFSLVLNLLVVWYELQTNEILGMAPWTIEGAILHGVLILIWPLFFVILLVVYAFPAIPYEGGPDPSQILGFELWELAFLSCFVIGSIIAFVTSELVLRLLSKEK